jgi:hypothetical protein
MPFQNIGFRMLSGIGGRRMGKSNISTSGHRHGRRKTERKEGRRVRAVESVDGAEGDGGAGVGESSGEEETGTASIAGSAVISGEEVSAAMKDGLI